MLSHLRPAGLFPAVEEPRPAMAGLFLYFSCFEEAHRLIDDCETTEGRLWHAIVHRMEPDSGNAAYWFRRAGRHRTFSKISDAAAAILDVTPAAEFRTGHWDPYAFILFCDRARTQPGSVQELVAQQIQLAEWQILFDHSARHA